MMFALVAMFVMTMSANAQSNDKGKASVVENITERYQGKISFDRLSSFLELTINQIKPVKTAMAQFNCSMEALYQLQDASKGAETWEKIQARHKMTMKNILSEKQYNKYIKMFDLTVMDRAERMMKQYSLDTASK